MNIKERNNNLRITILVFTLSVLLLWTAYNVFKQTTIDPQNLFANTYEVFELSEINTASVGQKTALVETVQLYKNGQYQDALPRLQNIQKNASSKNSPVQIAIGNCYMQLHQHKAAQNSLLSIINNIDDPFYEHALWYSALSFLKENKIDECKKQLEIIKAIPGADFEKSANRLLEDLE